MGRQVFSAFVGAAVGAGLLLGPELIVFSREANYSVADYVEIAILSFALTAAAGLAAIVTLGLPPWLVSSD